MSGWNTIQRIKRVEEEIDKLCFKFSSSKNSAWSEDQGSLSLKPKDIDSLPIYSRDAELFVGSLEGLETWLHGVRWAREYDMMLRLSDEKKREAAEQKERNKQLLRTLKENKIPEGISK
jgi:ABC-type lipopolysaccharide export system ATPase subunit